MVGVHPPPGGGGGGGGAAVSHAAAMTTSSSEDPNKKARKPYTITKSRESWTEQEHDKFLEALQLFDRDWKKIEAFVGSKTVIQIRSHAQKYFMKIQKNGTSEHVPPPRPKRKAAHPYPQKASKNAPLLSPPTAPFHASMMRNYTTSATVSSWAHSSVQPIGGSSVVKEDVGGAALGAWPTCEAADQMNQVSSLRVMPDFAQVYSFLGSVFDPETSDHLQKLKEMDPIDVETVLLLMQNLSTNLASPDFEDHRKLLSSYDGGTEELELASANNHLHLDRQISVAFTVKGE